jgi:AraC-like DNA-binding protein
MKQNANSTILFSCEKQKSFSAEQIVPEFSLTFIISGRLELQFAVEKITLDAGAIAVICKNELVKALKVPDENRVPFKAVTLFLTPETLHEFASKNGIVTETHYSGKPIKDLSRSKFLRAYFESLFPYFDQPEKLSQELLSLKTTEAICLLLDYDQGIKEMIFDFNEPHKIDLKKFMNQNFSFNISMKEFARLTGRSLSTFKRDFKLVYNNTPEKWLKERRLDEARVLLKSGQKPSEIYYNVGFENFSHFSTAYKQRFGHQASNR